MGWARTVDVVVPVFNEERALSRYLAVSTRR
jgi:hypothetical protein